MSEQRSVSEHAQETSRGRRKTRLVILVLALSFGVAYWIGAVRRAHDTDVIEGLAVRATDLDLGEIWEAADTKVRLPLRNQTDGTIHIHHFATSCACASVCPASLSLPAGETGTVEITLDLRRKPFADIDGPQRRFAVNVVPAIRGRSLAKRGWKIQGTLRSRITVDCEGVHFGERPIHNGAPISQRVLGTVHVPCEELEVAVDEQTVKAAVTSLAQNSRRFEITFTANPSLAAGDFRAEARIYLRASNGERALGLILPVAGTMQSEVRVLPREVFLGPAVVGQVAEATVLAVVPVATELRFDHAETRSQGLRVKPVVLSGMPGRSAFLIQQTIAKTGDQVNEVDFVFIDGRRNNLKALNLKVFYRGVPSASTAAHMEAQP